MRPDLVVMSSPNLDQNLSLLAAAEPLEAEAFVSELVVETLVTSVLPRLARIDGGSLDVSLAEPLENGLGDEFRPVI